MCEFLSQLLKREHLTQYKVLLLSPNTYNLVWGEGKLEIINEDLTEKTFNRRTAERMELCRLLKEGLSGQREQPLQRNWDSNVPASSETGKEAGWLQETGEDRKKGAQTWGYSGHSVWAAMVPAWSGGS